ncbi:MAG: type VI secretion system ATPase TssH [Gammaproteobacteria bacterium]|nr:type VI secretion system ATPase TssH [Gammaproteobacteria bacterium]
MDIDLDSLIAHLGKDTRSVLEGSSGKCVARGGYEITIEDFLLELLDSPDNELSKILKQFDISVAKVNRAIQLSQDLRSGNTSHPVFSPLLIDWLQESWLLCSLKFKIDRITSGAMILALLSNPNRFGRMAYFDLMEPISLEKLFNLLQGMFNENDLDSKVSKNENLSHNSIENALKKYTVDFTNQAENGEIDPVFCRDNEIRQIIDVLSRRRKNNPIAVGEPGVGKTAVVEGLALKIINNEVPDILKNVRLLGLDLGLLQAGASVKGEFEKRLKAVIEEVKSSEQAIILFIDEAHTLVGAGGQTGGSDAANLLKPALARGELRTIAATTWTEYKKYFEKDPALARRFQLVKLDEPSVEQAMVILRGLKDKYELTHGVYIRDEAIETAARLSKRYISGRLLPDKAIDVLDTACARVKISISSQPAILDDYESKTVSLHRELTALQRDNDMGLINDIDSINSIKDELTKINHLSENIRNQWLEESKIANEILDIRKSLAKKIIENDSEKELCDDTELELEVTIQDLMTQLSDITAELNELINNNSKEQSALVSYEVDAHLISAVIADWTGIPIRKMLSNETNEFLSFQEKMKERIKGQEHVIDILDNSIKITKAGLSNPDAPNGVFLFVGPSGVGKTETGIALADILYGGERFMTTINMSEFQEKHTVSRLIGSPPGYVGYGEGGLLTEAVRQRPYSVILLDEVEKADPEVLNLFYQVFDKGILNDGEGREIDFKNTTILLTSNLASDVISNLCSKKQFTESSDEENQFPDDKELLEKIRPILSQYFKPALLARMTIVPYFPVTGRIMTELTELKLERVAERLHHEHKIKLEYGDDVLVKISQRCQDVETGARNIDLILNNNIIPQISTYLLKNLTQESNFESLMINVNEQGSFDYNFA